MPDDNLSRAEVTERLCFLLFQVNEALGWTNACDCFCGKGGLWAGKTWTEADFRNNGVALEWIERLVRSHLPKETPDAE